MDTTAATIELHASADTASFTRTHVVADSIETPRLTLRPLKRHTNVRLGKKIDLTGYPSKTSLLAISNKHGWFFAGHEQTILASPLSDLRTFLAQNSTEEQVQFLCQVKLQTSPDLPLFVTLAAEESKLVVASTSSVSIWDVMSVITGETTLAHTFKLNNLVIVDVLPNPGENPETVAFLTTGHSQDEPCTLVLYNCLAATEIVRWSGLMKQGNAPVSASWSSRGKQIAIGLVSGDIVQYSPSSPSEAKATVPRAQGPDLQGTIPLALQWLSNTTFYVIYAQPRSEDLEEYEPTQYNYIISYDKKTNHAIDTLIPLPWEPYGLQREPGHLVTSLRSWGAFKHLVFVNDAHANDVGIIACLGDPSSPVADDSGRWLKVSLGEDSLTFPLSSELDDTSLVGMSMDLSATQKLLGGSQANGDDPAVPPAPILYMMTNDAVIVAFHIVNEDGGQYPAMAVASTSDASMRGGTEQGMDLALDKSQAPTPTAMEPDRQISTQSQVPSAFSASIPAPAFGQAGFGFGSAPAAPKFGTTGFGSGAATSPFATAASSATSPPAFRSSGPTLGFGAFANTKSTFGSSSFGAAPAQSPFGQSSFGSPSISTSSTPAFGASTTTTTSSAFGSSAGSGFSAFAGPKASFGQSSFGTSSAQSAFGSTAGSSAAFNTQLAFGTQASTTTPTATASDSALTSRNEDTLNATPISQALPNTSGAVASTATSMFKPSAGFGAFGGGAGSFTSNAFSNPKPVAFDGTATAFAGGGVPPASVTPSTALPTTGPGAPKFGQSTFGQSGFGQSKFGQSSFGQSSFGASKSAFAPPATYAVSPVPTSGGGFGAFAGSSTSFASLANQTADKNKPAYVEPVNSTDGEAGTLSKDSKPVFGLVKEAPSTEVKKGLTAGKSPFGSNAAVSKIGFGGPLRAKTGNEDDEEEDGEKKLKERFPEDEADKLEPEQIFTGPGLFESGGSSKSKPGDNAAKGLGRLGLSSGTEEKGKGAQRIESAFQAVPPLSAAIQHKTLAKKDQDQDSENEVSVELEDDVNEFLSEDDDYDDDLEEVDLTGDLEVHEFDDAEEVEEDDEEEDDEEEEEEEEDEEETASLPDDESDEATPPASKTGSSNKPQPKTVTPSVGSTAAGNVYNPFGRPVGTSKSQSENTKDDIPRSQASQSPLTPSRGSIHTPTKAADNSVASTSTTPLPLPRPSSADQLAPPTLQESPTRPKARLASPKAAFGSWGSSTATTQALPVPTGANSSIPTTLPDNKPQGQVTLGKSASPVANSLVNIATPSIVTPSEPQVRAIQPQHPELQNHLDQILINYGVLINSINERARKIRGAFDTFKAATAGASSIEGLPEPYRSMSLDRMKLALKEMNETTTALKSKTFILQQGLLDLQGASLRAEMKREEAARYLAARQNPQFMENLVKPRGLGPEHTENRNRLRKSIQLQTERVKEIDEHVRRLKRKAELFKAGNMSYQPPNLDQVRNACQNIDLYISTANERIAQLMTRVETLPNDRQEGTGQSQDELHRSRGHPRHLSSSFSVARSPISRTTSLDITQETIVTTVEVFSGEVKMTKLRDALVHSRSGKPAPLVKSNNRNTRYQVKADPVETWQPGRSRKDPFSKFKKPILLKDLATPKPNPHSSVQLGDVNQASVGGTAALSSPPVISSIQSQSAAPVAVQPESAAASLAPRMASTIDTHRRGGAGPGGSSRHSKAVPINRDRQNTVQDTSFSFGPPPVMVSSLKMPDKFVSLTAKKP